MSRTLKRLVVGLVLGGLLIYSVSLPVPPEAGSEVAQVEAAPEPQQGGEVRIVLFGRMIRVQLSVGMLGALVIVALLILLSLSITFALIARRRLRQTRAANENLEVEVRERKRAEEEISQLNASLEHRVAERTREVEDAYQQLAAANKELEAFAYSVSHDLRTPLRGIDGWSLALLEDYGHQLDGRAMQYLDRVRSETQRMGVLIEDLLELSRVTRSEMKRSLVDLSSVAGGIAAGLQEAHPGRRIEFNIAADVSAYGDLSLLQIVLTNLLSNAVKFTSGCPHAKIDFGVTQSDGETVFFVADNGVGFDMTFAGMLFGAFQRLHKSSEFPGTGIGLATVQRIIHRHGGRVWADAHPGQGATFYFTVRSAE